MKKLFLFICYLFYPLFNEGQTIFEKTYGGSRYDAGTDIIPTVDKGFLITGTTSSYGKGLNDIYFLKIDSTGKELWSSTYGDIKSDEGNSIERCKKGGYVLLGTSENIPQSNKNDYYLIRINDENVWQWSRYYGGFQMEQAKKVKQTYDGGFAIFGYTGSFDNLTNYFYLVRTDTQGVKLWENIYGTSNNDFGTSMDLCSDGGFIMTGYSEKIDPQTDILLVKADYLGNKKWMKFFGGVGNDYARAVLETKDKGFAIFGNSKSYGNTSDLLFIKTDSLGNEQWKKIIDTKGDDFGYDFIQLTDSSFTLIATSDSLGNNDDEDYFLIHLDKKGNELWRKRYGDFNEDIPYAIANVGDSGVVVCGLTYSWGNSQGAVYVVKTSVGGDTVVFPVKEIKIVSVEEDQIIKESFFLNPSDDFFGFENGFTDKNFEIEIYNIQGDRINCQDAKTLRKGIYFIKINEKRKQRVYKWVKL